MEMVQTVNQTNLVALRILASLRSLTRNISHSEDLGFHPKAWLRSVMQRMISAHGTCNDRMNEQAYRR